MTSKNWFWKVILPLITAAILWAGGSIVSLRERVAASESEQRSATRWLERIDEKVDRLDSKVDRLLRR